MSTITKKETIKLLRIAQKFQLEDCGIHSIDVQLYNDNGKLWFTITAKTGEYVFETGHCYEWRSYEDNKVDIDLFMDSVKNSKWNTKQS